jgi:hypothetical protein
MGAGLAPLQVQIAFLLFRWCRSVLRTAVTRFTTGYGSFIPS